MTYSTKKDDRHFLCKIGFHKWKLIKENERADGNAILWCKRENCGETTL